MKNIEKNSRLRIILYLSIIIHFLWTLSLLPHIVTWVDPSRFSLSAFDIALNRQYESNLYWSENLEKGSDYSLMFDHGFTHTLPAWPYLLGIAFRIFGISLITAKAVNLFISIFFIIAVYKLSVEIFKDNITALLLSILTSMSYQLFWLSSMARGDLLSVTLAIWSIFLFVMYDRKRSFGYALFSGLFAFISIIATPITIPLMTSLGVVDIFYRLIKDKKCINEVISVYFYPVLILSVLLVVWIIIYPDSLGFWYGTGKGYRQTLSWRIKQEFNRKLFGAYRDRYMLHLFIIFIFLYFFMCVKKKSLNRQTRAILLVIPVLTILNIVTDRSHSKSHLIIYTPFILSVFTTFYVHFKHHKIIKKYFIYFVVLSLLIPRIGKTYQILNDPEGTSYGRYIDNIKKFIPPRAYIICDATIMWGLYDQGHKIMHYGAPHNTDKVGYHTYHDWKEFYRRVDYIILSSKELFIPDENPASFTYRGMRKYLRDIKMKKLFEYNSKGSYGYNYQIFEVLR